MSWEVLNQQIDRFYQKQETVERLISIVKEHPEWAASDPRLKEVLHHVERDKAA